MEDKRVIFISFGVFVLVGALTFIMLQSAENGASVSSSEISLESSIEPAVPESADRISNVPIPSEE
ncbi:MAG TPA: hypothetical protein VJB12_02305, partial [Candidatus Nanoarchaeia archaeon]|nr:hypothetical protein [Candidatus Nanoarchaeia archaeon]